MGRPEDLDFMGEEAVECQDSYQRWLTIIILESSRSVPREWAFWHFRIVLTPSEACVGGPLEPGLTLHCSSFALSMAASSLFLLPVDVVILKMAFPSFLNILIIPYFLFLQFFNQTFFFLVLGRIDIISQSSVNGSQFLQDTPMTEIGVLAFFITRTDRASLKAPISLAVSNWHS